FHNKSISVTVCLSLILGGAIGNLIDRIRMGYVIDYLSFTIFPPVFNLADSAIVVGAILLCLIIAFNKNIVM
ncbi:MAG TPA: signal peptidase II, partial [Bacillota bacterium]|nr:signal peptidase II [Bacillota bacterium]